jgi:phospholipase C
MARNRGRGGNRPRHPQFDPARRRLLTGIAGAAGALALPGCGNSPSPAASGGGLLPNPADSGIDHIIVLMMENRSFDHFLGWLPGADGIQSGLSYVDNNGIAYETYPLGTGAPVPEYQNCSLQDPDHSYVGGHTQYNNGACDGFLKTVDTIGDHFPIGYYVEADLPFFSGAARTFTTCDRYFPGILSQTFPNRFYMHSGQTDRNDNALQPFSTLPTIWDLMLGKGLSALYYYVDVPFLGMWGNTYSSLFRQFSAFLTDAASGTLPNLAFVDPNFGGSVGEENGASMDDHPHADIRDGQAFMNRVYDAVRASPNWERTLLVINYDEWGGFFDHVVPPVGPISDAEQAITTTTEFGPGDGRLGFRVPCLLIGPRARRSTVDHTVLEPNSILDFVRWRFGLGPLSARSDKVNNLALALDFVNPPNLDKPDFPVASGPFAQPCQQPPVAMSPAAWKARQEHFAEWRGLWELSRKARGIA